MTVPSKTVPSTTAPWRDCPGGGALVSIAQALAQAAVTTMTVDSAIHSGRSAGLGLRLVTWAW